MGKVQASDCQGVVIKTAQEVTNKDNQVSHISLLGFLSVLAAEF